MNFVLCLWPAESAHGDIRASGEEGGNSQPEAGLPVFDRSKIKKIKIDDHCA